MKKGLLLCKSERVHGTPGITQQNVFKGRAQTWDHAFIGVKGGMPGILWVYSLLVNLKHNRWEESIAQW